MAARVLVCVALAALLASCSTSPKPPPGEASAPPVAAAPPSFVPPVQTPAASAATPAGPTPLFRLPGDVRPEREAVEVEVVPDKEGFTGHVTLQLRFAAARNDFWVSARGLALSEGRLEVGGESLAVQVEPEDGIGAAHVRLPHSVGPGAATLHLAFAGSFNTLLVGLYRVKTADRWYAFTHFESIDARRAFPCFDEPAFKIPWDVTLIVRAGDTAVSNTNVLEETPAGGGLKRVKFQTTRPLPSYLVAMAVGEFDEVKPPPLAPNDVRHRPLQLRGFATKGRGAELEYAMRTGAELVVLLERWFGMEYPYEKLDYIAVPDFKSGAMENAGAITFTEWLLLVDPKNAPERQKLYSAVVLAHEMAHQWFGDLVTMAWWDDLWLNESFASFMEAQITGQWKPALHYDLVFLESIQRAMRSDGLARTGAIRQKIVYEADTSDIDVDVVYEKGAAVIGMFEQFLGRDAFRAAIHGYLLSHADGNATLENLLSALSMKSAAVGPAFRSFVEQPGVPLVEAQLQCRAGTATLGLRQSRYRPLGSEAPDGLWKVPVCARVDGVSGSACTLLTEAQGDLALSKKGCPRWAALNPGASGYYRWTLPAKQLQALLSANALTEPERLSVASNLVAAFHSGGMQTRAVVLGLERFAKDAAPEVAREPADFLATARRDVVSADVRPKLEAYGRRLYRPVLARLGWKAKPGEPAPTRAYRGDLISFLALTAEDTAVRARAARLAQAYLGQDGTLHPDAVDPNLVPSALSAAAVSGDARLFQTLVDRLEKAVAADVRDNLLVGLASFRDPTLATQARALTFDKRLRTDERMFILWIQLRRLETHDEAWSWMQAHVSELTAALPPTHVSLLLEAAAGCSADDATALERLRGAMTEEGAAHALDKSIEATRLCAALVAAQRANADAFFKHAP